MDLSEGWDTETVQDAVDVLQDLVLWQMTEQRWAHVAAILDRMEVALATGDGGELNDAVAELELSGPVRILRIGSTGQVGIPQPVFERRNTLVHALTAEQQAEQRVAPEGDGDRHQPR